VLTLGVAALGAPAAAQTTPPADKTTVGEVIVTGQRAALKSAQAIKKNSTQLVDSITAVDIGALPDRSVVEALQRIPGVTITRTPDPRDADRVSVEGSGVQVRGLNYVRSELNGRDSFSAKNGRQLSFDDIPPELMAGVDVYKNPSAEIVEGGVGGTVDLRTRLPFDQSGHLIAFSLDESYGDLAKVWKPAGSLLLSDRWMTPIGEFGLLGDISDSKYTSRTDTLSVDPYFARNAANNDALVPGQTVFVPGGFGYRSLIFNRERQGFDVAAQYKPSDKLLVTAQFIRSAAYSTENENAVGIDPGTGFDPATPTSFTYNSAGVFTGGTIAPTNPDVIDERYNTTRSVTSDYSLNIKYNPTDRLSLSADVQHIVATTKALDFTIFDSFNGSVGSSTLNLHGNSVPFASIPNSPAFANPANYYWDAAMDFHDHNDADEWAERIDGSYTFDGDWLKTFRFGVRHTEREAITRETNFNWGYVTQTWTGAGLALLNGTGPTAAGNTIPSTFVNPSNFFGGNANLPGGFFAGTAGFLSNWVAASNAILAAENRPASCCGPWTPFNGNYTAFTAGGGSGSINNQREDTDAIFGLLNFAHEMSWGKFSVPMDGNIGVRIVDTKASGTGSLIFPLCTGTCLTGVPATLGPPPTPAVPPFPTSDQTFQNGFKTTFSGARSYPMVLPSLNLRFKLEPNLFLRLAASQSMVRPDFSQMEPTLTIGTQAGIVTGGNCVANPSNVGTDCVFRYTAFEGNPTLKPIRANSYDFAAEWYFSNTGSLTGTLFYKDLYNFITTGSQNVPFTNNGVTENVLLTRPYNAGHGVVKGFELTYQQYFDMLPGPLKGLGVQSNFTYIDSKGGRNAAADPYDTTQIANAASPGLPLEGLSKTSYNLAGLYDYGPFSARVAYNWRAKYLMTTSAANINIPAWADDFGQLDASVFYSLTPKVKIGLQGSNLTAAIYKESVSYPTVVNNPGMTPHNWVDSDRRITAVLRAQF